MNYDLSNYMIQNLAILSYIMAYIYENQEDREVVYATRQSLPPKKNSKGKAQRNRNITRFKQVLKVNVNDENIKTSLESNERVYKQESWTVRGHPRHLSSGKVVWIDPYIKGQGRHKPKDYKF